MPFYMDRHDVKGVTTQEVVAAHHKDLAVQDKFGTKFIGYWCDEERGTIFCFAQAPNAEAVNTVHSVAHGMLPGQIIEVDQALTEAFLGTIKDPSKSLQRPGAVGQVQANPAFRTIMFTDLMESTNMTTDLGDARAMQLLRIHNAMIRNALKAHHGLEVKHTGDGVMASFASVSSAVECAIAIQRDFATYNHENPAATMHVRIGLSAGEPVAEDQDLFGAAVQLAARICAHSESDEILAAQVVRDLCLGKRLPFADRGQVTPRGFDQPVGLYQVMWRAE
jgi:class 3 adenylate cyclase